MELEKSLHIPELYVLKHRKDNEIHQGYDYRNNILKKTLSRSLFKNDKTNGFLLYLEEMVVHMIDSNVLLRNWFNPTVSKYYTRHNN